MKRLNLYIIPMWENIILDNLDLVIKIHQEASYTIVPYRIDNGIDVIEAFSDFKELIIVMY